MRDNDREKASFGRDGDKAVGVRIGVEFPYTGFDIVTSIYTGKYAESVTSENLRLSLYGVDASYQTNGFTVRGEVVHARQQITGKDLKKTGGYIQAFGLIGRAAYLGGFIRHTEISEVSMDSRGGVRRTPL